MIEAAVNIRCDDCPRRGKSATGRGGSVCPTVLMRALALAADQGIKWRAYTDESGRLQQRTLCEQCFGRATKKQGE